jgi:hypothetical protein
MDSWNNILSGKLLQRVVSYDDITGNAEELLALCLRNSSTYRSVHRHQHHNSGCRSVHRICAAGQDLKFAGAAAGPDPFGSYLRKYSNNLKAEWLS